MSDVVNTIEERWAVHPEDASLEDMHAWTVATQVDESWRDYRYPETDVPTITVYPAYDSFEAYIVREGMNEYRQFQYHGPRIFRDVPAETAAVLRANGEKAIGADEFLDNAEAMVLSILKKLRNS